MKENVLKNELYHNECTLYNNYDYKTEDYKASFDEYIELNELDIKNYDEELYDFINRDLTYQYEDLLANIKYGSYEIPCVVTGTVGRWNGRFNIYPKRFETLSEAINECCNNVDGIVIKLKDGKIEVKGVHHDATNYYQITCLNKLGQMTAGADLTKKCYHKLIKDYII
jgi:hypothetical protein